MDRSSRKKKKSKKWLKIIASIIGVIILAIVGYSVYLYQNLASTVDSMHEERTPSSKRETEFDLSKGDPISFLLMGVDERTGDRGRADSLIVVTLNPNTDSMNMLSIPRDTYVEIEGRGMDKVNHSYAFGGTDLTLTTVEKFLDIPIDYYVKVNMESFKDIVDTLGGVTVNNTKAFSYEGKNFNEGSITLNGESALAYARVREIDSDFGRQDRQREVIRAIIEKGASPAVVTKIDDLLAVAGGNIKTNMTFKEMQSVQANYADARHNNNQTMIKGTGQKINGIYYYVVPEEERQAVISTLKTNLELN
ncbi:LCP family glycopolymer transferase [Litchfieldia salsa]|uniref:Cell envelope-related function transcriptional attenuator common domain-containing protein n=1 Tax=Litchfieldia salsa TaxID=930152 RepID=A0A1H0TZI6_9BACI|nr:LCP family protein [Litchfieldia salsa]SDP59482.1 cell envelope-related function transcriptional attenuator common domain-containing protein [Litchfieldia salsa]